MRSVVPADGGRAPESPSPMVGRTGEVEELERTLASPFTRLVTVTGPPGVGKTRVAREVAARAAGRFPHGVHFVDLSPVRTAPDALVELGRCCGVGRRPGSETQGHASYVGSRLSDQTALLVLDCCERLPGLGAELSIVLASAPRVKVLATSRTRLGPASESELALPPLAVPDEDAVGDLDRFAATPAVALLLERARQAQPGFTLDARNAAAVRTICLRADGLPLAIELLAPRLASFSAGELAVRVRNRQVLLDSTAQGQRGRHRTLRAAIAWSHDLLGPAERKLFRAVSVFPHSWTLAAAEHVLGDPEVDVPAVTGSLVDRNMVQRIPQPSGAFGFRMLDSIREFATEQLDRHGEGAAAHRRHVSYYTGPAVAAETAFGGPDESLALDWLRAEHVNLRRALEYSLGSGDVISALPLAAANGWFELSHGLLGDASEAVQRALAAAQQVAGPAVPPELPPELLAGATLVAGVLAEGLGELEEAESHLQRALALSEQNGNFRRQAVARAFLGHVARHRHYYGEAREQYARALALHEATGNEHGRAWAWFDFGLLALEAGDLAAAATHLEGARSRFASAGERWHLAWTVWALGETRARQHVPDEAALLVTDALALHRGCGDLRGIAECLESLAVLACQLGGYERAARLLGAGDRLREQVNSPAGMVDPATASARTTLAGLLGREQAARALAAGAAMPLDDAVRLATSLAHRSESPTRTPLSPRQQEVAVLVAGGRTNRQIAHWLGITEKTVEVHLAHAMKRLGAQNRAEVAAHAVEAGLRPDPQAFHPAVGSSA